MANVAYAFTDIDNASPGIYWPDEIRAAILFIGAFTTGDPWTTTDPKTMTLFCPAMAMLISTLDVISVNHTVGKATDATQAPFKADG
jgi:hypothetical protein